MSNGKGSQLLTHEKTNRKNNINIITWLGILISFIAVSISTYIVCINRTFKKEQDNIYKSVIAIQESFDNYKNSTPQLPNNIEVIIQDLTNQLQWQKDVTKSLEIMMVSNLKPQVDFLLREFENEQSQQLQKQMSVELDQRNIAVKDLLIRILGFAEFYLREFQDVKKVNELLNFAQQILVNANDMAYVKLKEAIEQDKQELSNMKFQNKELIWNELSVLISNINKYECKENKKEFIVDSVKNNLENTKESNKFILVLNKMWSGLRSLVKIRHKERNVETINIFTELTASLQKARLKLLLEQAQLGSFCNNNSMFHSSLLEAKKIFLTYFDMDSEFNKKAISEIDSLLEINVTPMLADSMNSFKELNEILKSKLEADKQ